VVVRVILRTSCSDLSNGCVPGGGFHQPVSAMLSGSAGSPFRSSSGHRAPWPPPALHAAAEGKLRIKGSQSYSTTAHVLRPGRP
jgi:hypothetical protein